MPNVLLVTGGTGMLGSHLVRLAAASGAWDQVHSTYLTTNPNFHKTFWHFVDARNLITPTLEKIHPTCILHTMAMSSPDQCERKKLDAWQVNVKATDEIIDFAARNGARVIFTSSDLVFDGATGHYSESMEPSPISFYGDSKMEAENHMRERLSHGNFVTARLSLLYGFNLNQRPTFFKTMCDALETKKPVHLFTDQFRSPLSVQNAAECLMELASGSYNGLLHVGGPERLSRYEFGVRVAGFLKGPTSVLQKVTMKDIPSAARRPEDVSLDSSRARSVLKTPLKSVEDGLKSLFEK